MQLSISQKSRTASGEVSLAAAGTQRIGWPEVCFPTKSRSVPRAKDGAVTARRAAPRRVKSPSLRVRDLLRDMDIPRLSVADEVFARPEVPKVFVSSRMRGGVLRNERKAVADEIEGTRMATAWYWERSSYPGPFSSRHICLGHAATSQALIMILIDDLTPITKAEYLAAKKNGVYCCILIKEGATLTTRAQRFVDRESRVATLGRFRNLSELRSQSLRALRGGMAYGLWLRNVLQRAEQDRRRVRK
jgi:hypothetical protein